MRVAAGANIDFETDQSHDITVETTDSAGNTYSEVVTLTVKDVNEAPSDITLTGGAVDENAVAGTTVATLSTVDVDAGDSHTYAVTNDPSGFFEIVGNEVRVAAGANIDFETDQTHDITIETTDSAGNTYSEVVTLIVNDVNEDPTDITLTGSSVDENAGAGTTVATLSTADVDAGDTHTYAITNDPSGFFEIVGNEVRVAAGATIDFETDQNHDITVETTDSAGNTYSEVITVNVNDLNEAPTDITVTAELTLGPDLIVNGSFEAPDIGSNSLSNFASIPGWTASSGLIQIHDNFGGHTAPDGSQYLDMDAEVGVDHVYQDVQTETGQTYQLDFSAADRMGQSTNAFQVYWNGDLVANVDPTSSAWEDFSFNMTGTGGLDRLEFREVASGDDAFGALIDSVSLQAVYDPVDAPHVIENSAAGTVVATLDATDVDAGDSHTYAITSDPSGFFEIVGDEVRVAAGAALDFETAQSHDIAVEVTDAGGNTYSEVITIEVDNLIDETPTDLALTGGSVDESAAAGTAVATLSTVDADAGDSHTYAITNDPSGFFEIVGNEVRVAAGASIDFETDQTHDITIQSTDAAGNTYSEVVTLTVNDLNEAPTDITFTGGSVDENADGAQTGISLNQDGGNDAYLQVTDSGDIVGGLSEFTIEVDFSSPGNGGTYTNLFSYHAGGGSDEIELGINVGSPTEFYIEVGEQATPVSGFDASQVLDGNDHQVSMTWDNTSGDWEVYVDGASVASGTGIAAGHTIASGGEIVLGQEQDSQDGGYDSAQHFAGTYNDVRIFDDVRTADEINDNLFSEVSNTEPGLVANWQMNDLSGGVTTDTVSGNDLTVGQATGTGFIASTPLLTTEDGVLVATLSTADPDAGDSHTYAITNDPSGFFEIVGNEVRVASNAGIDFEANPSHDITVETTDTAGNTYSEVITITVNDLNEAAPTDIALTGNSAIADSSTVAAGAVVGTAVGVDADVGDTLTYALTDDAGGLFSIDSTTGDISVTGTGNVDLTTLGSQTVDVEITDSGGLTYSETVGLHFGTDDNDAIFGGNLGYSDLVSSHTPVGYWRLSDGSSTAVDESGNAHDGAYTGDASSGVAGALTGDTDTAATFDGSNDYVEIPPSTDFQLSQGSVTMWFNAATIGSQMGLLSRDSSGFDGGGHVTIWVNNSGQLEVRHQDTSSSYTLDSGTATVSAGEWHMMTYSWGPDGMELNLDAQSVASNSVVTTLAGNDEPWIVGANQWASGDGVADNVTDFFNGQIDEVALFDQPLTDAETQSLYDAASLPASAISGVDTDDIIYGFDGADTINGGAGDDVVFGGGGSEAFTDLVSSHTPVGYWRLSDGSSTAVDESGNGHDGAYTGDASSGVAGALTGDTDTAATFDGSNDYVEIPPSTDFQLSQGSVTMWFNAATIGSQMGLLSRDSSGFDGGGHVTIWVNNSGQLEVRHQDTSSSYTLDSGTATVSAGEWHMMTYSWGPDGMELNLDAQSVASNSVVTTLAGNDEPWIVGANQWASGDGVADNVTDFFNGQIDEVALFDQPLTDADIQSLHDAASGQGNTIDGGDGDDTLVGGAAADVIAGDQGDDILEGGIGNDILDGGVGDDTLEGGLGDDTLTGGDGSELFLFHEGDGDDVADGGAGAGWTDTLEIMDSLGGSDIGVFGADWTVTITSGSIDAQDADSITLAQDTDGFVTLQDGSQFTFTDLERIEW